MAPCQTFTCESFFILMLASVVSWGEGNPTLGHSMLATKHASSKVDGAEQTESKELTFASSVDLIRKLAASPSNEELAPALLEGLSSVKVTPEVSKVISEVLDGLSDTFTSIVDADKDDTSEMETLYKQFETIDTHFVEKESELKGLEQIASGGRSLHRNCRNDESSLVTSVEKLSKELGDLHTKKEDKALIADDKAKDLAEQLKTLMAQGAGGVSLDFLRGHHKIVTNYGDALQTHIDSVHAHKGKREEKEGTERVMTDKNVECDTKQMKFENSVCSVGDFSQGMCETYVSSYELHSDDYKEVRDNVQQSVANRKKAWSHFKLIECYLTEIKQNFSVDLKCHEKKEENPELDIAIKPPMSRRKCPGVPPFPCSDAFSQQEYSDMPADVAVKCALDCKKGSSEAPKISSADDCPAPTRPEGDTRSVNAPVYKDGMCFYFLEAHGSTNSATGEDFCHKVVPESELPCVANDAFYKTLKSVLDDGACGKCKADGVALGNGMDSKCVTNYEPIGTNRNAKQCTSQKPDGSWTNRCDNYVSSLCVLGRPSVPGTAPAPTSPPQAPAPVYESCGDYGAKESDVGPRYETGRLEFLPGFTDCQAECSKIPECSGWHTHYSYCYVHAPMGTVKWQGYQAKGRREWTGYKADKTKIVMHDPFHCGKKKGWVDSVDPKYQVEVRSGDYSCGEDGSGNTYFNKKKDDC